MNSSKLLACAVVPVILLINPNAGAVESLSSKELSQHCAHYERNSEGKDATFCVRYVQGFIDGAVATDERVMLNVAAEYEQGETLTERAFRTRAPKRSLHRYGPTVYADFCIGTPVPLKEVVEHIIGNIVDQSEMDMPALARDSVYNVLRRDYPCETDDDNQ